MCNYNLLVHHEDGAYWAEVPALPGCYSSGDTLDELKANVREAIRFHLEGLNSFEVPEGAALEQVMV